MFDQWWAIKLDTTMSFRATALRQSRLVVLLFGLITGSVCGQVQNSPVVFANQDAITTSFVRATNLTGTNSSSSSDENQWLKVELHYSVTPPPTMGNHLDSVEFKVWIEGRDLLDPQGKPNEGIAVALTGSVTYVNVLQARDAYAVFYVHPSTLGRYSTKEGYEDFDRKFDVHAEIYVGGKAVDAIDKKKGETLGWHLQLKAVPGLVFRQNQTPFVNADPDRYPAIKLPVEAAAP